MVVFNRGEGENKQKAERVDPPGLLCLFLSHKQIFILPPCSDVSLFSPSLSLSCWHSPVVFREGKKWVTLTLTSLIVGLLDPKLRFYTKEKKKGAAKIAIKWKLLLMLRIIL